MGCRWHRCRAPTQRPPVSRPWTPPPDARPRAPTIVPAGARAPGWVGPREGSSRLCPSPLASCGRKCHFMADEPPRPLAAAQAPAPLTPSAPLGGRDMGQRGPADDALLCGAGQRPPRAHRSGLHNQSWSRRLARKSARAVVSKSRTCSKRPTHRSHCLQEASATSCRGVTGEAKIGTKR